MELDMRYLGTYERYSKTRTSCMRGAYAYRIRYIAIFYYHNQHVRKELEIDLEKKKKNNLKIIFLDYFSFVPYVLWFSSELILSDEK